MANVSFETNVLTEKSVILISEGYEVSEDEDEDAGSDTDTVDLDQIDWAALAQQLEAEGATNIRVGNKK